MLFDLRQFLNTLQATGCQCQSICLLLVLLSFPFFAILDTAALISGVASIVLLICSMFGLLHRCQNAIAGVQLL